MRNLLLKLLTVVCAVAFFASFVGPASARPLPPPRAEHHPRRPPPPPPPPPHGHKHHKGPPGKHHGHPKGKPHKPHHKDAG